MAGVGEGGIGDIALDILFASFSSFDFPPKSFLSLLGGDFCFSGLYEVSRRIGPTVVGSGDFALSAIFDGSGDLDLATLTFGATFGSLGIS